MLETALTFKDMAAGAGINVEVVSHPVDAFWAEFWKKTPFFVSNWIGRPTAEMMLSQLYMCDSSGTEGKWCNPDFDALIMEARATLDPEARRDLLAAAVDVHAAEGRHQGIRQHPVLALVHRGQRIHHHEEGEQQGDEVGVGNQPAFVVLVIFGVGVGTGAAAHGSPVWVGQTGYRRRPGTLERRMAQTDFFTEPDSPAAGSR